MRHNKNFFILLVSFILSCKTSASSLANKCGWQVKETSRSQSVIFALKNQKAMSFADTSKHSTKLNNLGDQLVSSLKYSFESAIKSELQSAPEYESSSVSILGPFQLSISGSPQSNNAISSISMKSIGVSASFVKRKYILGFVRVSARCSLNFSMDNPKLVGSYDLINNRMSFAQGTSLNLQHSQNCSTSLGWIPVLGSFVDRLITNKVGDFIGSKIAEISQRVLNASYTPGDLVVSFQLYRMVSTSIQELILGEPFGKISLLFFSITM